MGATPSRRARLLNLALRLTVKRRLSAMRSTDAAAARASRARLAALERWIPPPPRGTRVEHIALGGVPAERVCARRAERSRALLYLHGGAYVLGSPALYRDLAARLSAACAMPVLVPDYRLAPEHPFPAALEDARAAWSALLAGGIAPQRAALAGDSAGGGLALALMVALRAAGEPLPACAALLAPWTDLTASGESLRSNAGRDPYLVADLLRPVAALYHGAHDPGEALISPLFADLRGLPRLLVHASDAEILRSDSERLVARARAAGVPAELHLWAGMAHVFHLFAALLPEARAAIAEIGAFVRAATR